MRGFPSERLTKMEDSEVEVTYKEKGFKRIWYKAIIEGKRSTNPRSRLRELYLRLRKDDKSSTPLCNLTSKVVSFRPVPPRNMGERMRMSVGSVVDAGYKGGWWIGFVVKEIGDDKCLVFLDAKVDVVEFRRLDLRPHFDWVDEKLWVRRQDNREFLRSLADESVFSPGTMVEVSCEINGGEVIWVPSMIIKEIEEGAEENEEDAVESDEENEEKNDTTEEDAEESDEDEEENEEDAEKSDEQAEENEEDDEENNEKIEEDSEVSDEDAKENGEEDAGESDEENEELDKKKFIVKFCDNSSSCKGDKATVALHRVRPIPPSICVEKYVCWGYVEAFHGTGWRQGQVMCILPQKQYRVRFKAKSDTFIFQHSKLRPLKVWEDSVWKTKESLLSHASGNKMDGSVINADTPSLTKESGPPATSSRGITAPPLKQAEAETQGNTPKRTLMPKTKQNGLGKHSTQENENGEDNNRKRKRDQNDNVEEDKANDTTMVLPFEKKLPIWKTVEAMEVFKTNPQSPHFSPLVETRENSREMTAVGMMLTFSGLLEEVKTLQPSNPKSTLESLNDSFTELEQHGFDVKAPQSRIHKLLSLKDKQTEKKSEKVEIEQKILELQRLKEETEKKIAEMKPNAATINQQLDDVELQFRTTVSAPW